MEKGFQKSLYHAHANTKVYDISVPLNADLAVYPGDTGFSKNTMMSFTAGDECLLTGLTFSAHFGTHLDAPAHFFANGKTVDSYPVENCILPARVVEVFGGERLNADDLKNVSIVPGEALLLKTANSLSGIVRKKDFSEEYVSLSEEGAVFCAGLKPSLIGIDCFSIDSYKADGYPAHLQILGSDIFILEGIDLSEVSPGTYTLCCLPLKLTGVEASPVRAVLFSREPACNSIP